MTGNRIRPPRKAISLVEALIAIGMIAVLVALLLPAVQRVRETAYRVQCTNNLKQLALACFSFHDSCGALPTNGGWAPGQSANIATNQPGENYDWGLADPTTGGINQPGSWGYSVLPFLEKQDAYQKRDCGAALKTFLCPTRNRVYPQVCPSSDPGPVFVGWTYDTGGINPWAKTDYAGNAAVIIGRTRVMTLAMIRDGTSKTILLGEKSIDPQAYNTGGWGWDEPIFAGGSSGTTRQGAQVNQDVPGVSFMNNWGTPHAGVCQFAYADGSVHGTSVTVPVTIMQALLSPQGGEIVDPDGYEF